MNARIRPGIGIDGIRRAGRAALLAAALVMIPAASRPAVAQMAPYDPDKLSFEALTARPAPPPRPRYAPVREGRHGHAAAGHRSHGGRAVAAGRHGHASHPHAHRHR